MPGCTAILLPLCYQNARFKGCESSYVPPPAIRELREVCRNRHQVIRLRRRVVQMVRSLLLRSGVADAPMRRLYSVRGLAWLETVTLPADTAVALTRWRHVLIAIQAEAVAADAGVAARAQGDPIARRLDKLVGIGPVLALTIRAEVGDIARFRRGAELASYAGIPDDDVGTERQLTHLFGRHNVSTARFAGADRERAP